MKRLIKSLIPPILLDLYRKIKNKKYGWHGDYKSWEEAKKKSTGYDDNQILEKVRISLLKVKNGEAVYERDSVIFDEIEYSWPLLAGLMYASAKSKGKLKVLDFGGSLGSTYFQNKKFLDKLNDVSWSIVEQKHFVDVGKADFEDGNLKFYYDLDDCVAIETPNVLVLSSVLQYIEKPYELLDELLKYDFEFVIFDRTIFSKNKTDDYISVQITDDVFKNATIPCWLFHEKKFKNYFHQKFMLIETFILKHEENDYKYEKGFIWQKQ